MKGVGLGASGSPLFSRPPILTDSLDPPPGAERGSSSLTPGSGLSGVLPLSASSHQPHTCT